MRDKARKLHPQTASYHDKKSGEQREREGKRQKCRICTNTKRLGRQAIPSLRKDLERWSRLTYTSLPGFPVETYTYQPSTTHTRSCLETDTSYHPAPSPNWALHLHAFRCSVVFRGVPTTADSARSVMTDASGMALPHLCRGTARA